ncbi:MAG: HRDC domain-containing protein [Bacteroidaceae bacterium]|nr:HRDC domain-containing protein [Bacteroidaceae bacterium]
MNQLLYNDLYRLRQRIKDRERQVQGRAPTVCTDNALYEIAELCPKKLTDFQSVSGIGKTFIENYGEEFLAVILKHTEVQTEKKINMSSSAAETIKELEKKLVSINRRNRLLYMPKMSNKYAFDMFEVGSHYLFNLLFGKVPAITLANISEPGRSDFDQELHRFKRVTQLLREINKDLRDKGQNDLYIGYPYVIGRIPGENFDVRAPLALFPVTAEKTATCIRLSLDESRDVIYNNTLVLAYFKFNNISKPLAADVIETVSESNFLSTVLDFYTGNEMRIVKEQTELLKFREYKADEFPHFKSGELHLEPCAVLGKFPICSSSIQKDFDDILRNNEINSLLNDLLLNSDEIDYYSDSYSGEESSDNNVPLSISEKNLVYINELNSSQEAVLSAINSCNELVVQGPPGTGKSQVITSLISEFVSAGKTVLMVSEKKTALDVVYSRLGELSQYALLIDDVGNKNAFYQQLSKMVHLGDTSEEKMSLDFLSEKIDALVKRLEIIADKLYRPNDFGIEPYKLYLQNRRYDLSDGRDRAQVNNIIQLRDARLLNIQYAELERIYQLFADSVLCGNLEKHIDIITAYPWLYTIRSNMSEYETLGFSEKLNALKNAVLEWKGKNFFARLFTRGKVTAEIKQVLSEYFSSSTKEMIALLLNNIDGVIESVDSYITYQELKPLYATLTEPERLYIHSLVNIRKSIQKEATEVNSELHNELLYEHIGRFEANHRSLFQDIENFDTIIRSLSEAIANKQKLSRKRLQMLLAEGMHNFTISKRHNEILRALEGKRKWSVNKFINKFNFELFKSVKIWLLTPEVVSEIIPLQTGIFDLVVFDEASQMYVEKGVPSILRAKKVIVAGDHKQLRPSNLGAGRIEMDTDDLPEDIEITAALEEESLLDLARFKYSDVLLNFHYRSKYEELIAFSNHAFYKGRLYVSPNATPPERPPIEVHKMENAMWRNRSNVEEAKYIVDLLKSFFAERKENETVGIITFNSSQRDLIDDLIDEECAKNPEFATAIRTELSRKKDGEDIGLFVKNIESVQGDERDVIIFSIGYAKNENGRLIRNFGWLNQKGGENRLNVAISRAKKKIHIVTSFDPAELQVEDTKNDGPRYLKKYLEYSFAVSTGDKEAAKQILQSFGDDSTAAHNVSFDSDFENQVYDALKAEGYDVDTQIGIGGYSIDLAIRKNGKYILGIECDGKLYHSSKSARERDYHRQKYLESRGWRIHRIWSTNWWKNPQREIQKIITVVDSLG